MTEPAGRGAETEPGADRGDDAPPIGLDTRLGRYQLVAVLGAGGMGVVFEAHDPELGRAVAVKVLNARSGELDATGARLRREGATMARLTHANVIRVYDVGFDAGHVFVAMELVRGTSLAEWVASTRRTVDDVVAVFVQAGRGLAAAHDAGLVHRDFKPHNVLVSDDGRVLVTDFGLARDVGDGESGPALGVPPPAAATVTRTGRIMGTPAYMAPEQKDGVVDASADQYSFCVALYEALHGTRPGEPVGRDAPAARIPSWLERALERGLALDPAARWPSMPALLAALETTPRRRRRRTLAAAALVATGVVTATVLVVARPAGAPRACSNGPAIMRDTWNAAQRDAILAAAAAEPRRAETAGRATAWLDSQRDAWLVEHRDACEATHVHRTQSPALLDQRMGCLRERRIEMKAIAERMAGADAATLDRLRDSLEQQPSPATCSDPAALSSQRPIAPEARRAFDRMSDEITRLDVEVKAGNWPDAEAGLAQVVADAERRGWSYLAARAHLIRGHLRNEEGEGAAARGAFEAAARAAADSDARLVEAEAWTSLLAGLADRSPNDARALMIAADNAVRRIGDPAALRLELMQAEGWIAMQEGDLGRSRARLAEALAFAERELPDDDAAQLTALGNLAAVESELGAHPDAIAHRRRALPLCEAHYGPRHPGYAVCLSELGSALYLADDSESRVLYGRALALLEAQLDPDAALLANVLNGLAGTETDAGDHAAAELHMTRAVEIYERVGPPHMLGRALVQLANNRARAGRREDAATAARRALVVMKEAAGEDHIFYAVAELALGGVAPCGEAGDHLAHAIPILTAGYGPDHDFTARAVSLRDRCAGHR